MPMPRPWCCGPEIAIKTGFVVLTFVYAVVTYGDTQDPSPTDPSHTEWDKCWPIATWYISWHVGICYHEDLAGYDIPQGPDWKRLSILFTWYLSGLPIAYAMHSSCSVEAPGTWARAIRVFIEGIVAFGLGAFIYALGRCLFPTLHSRPVLLPFPPEKVPPAPSDCPKVNALWNQYK
ncbi:hypothetical protein BC826DRAFT_1041647 [Russula brevipes]|nr:hypothetical protein BC826DRAFT_1041647 [Russula brevipes]